MSQYATQSDLARGGLRSAALSGVSSTDQDAALVAASGEADGYLAKRYMLPLTAWGDDLTRRVVHIATYDLLSTRGYAPASGVDPLVEKRYNDAIFWLRDVSKGVVEPQGIVDSSATIEEQAPITGGSDVMFRVGDSVFSDIEAGDA